MYAVDVLVLALVLGNAAFGAGGWRHLDFPIFWISCTFPVLEQNRVCQTTRKIVRPNESAN